MPRPQLQVFDLGASGNDTPRKAAEISEFLEAASRAPSGSGQPVFRLGSDKRGAAVKYITPICECGAERDGDHTG